MPIGSERSVFRILRKIGRKLRRFRPAHFAASIGRSSLCFLGWLVPGPAHDRPHYFFAYNNRNHRRLLEGAEQLLRESGETTLLVPSDRMKEIMFRARRGDVIAVCCDWSPHEVGQSMALLKWKGVKRVGLQEGIFIETARKYIWIDTFLAWGDVYAETAKRPALVVGSPTVERVAKRRRDEAKTPFALINHRGKDAWLTHVQESCLSAGLTPIVSGHPQGSPAYRSTDFHSTIPDASVLITEPSTTIYEAFACGVPVVVMTEPEPNLMELAAHGAAFETVKPGDDLAAAIRRTLETEEENAEAREAFLQPRVSIDPSRPAPLRIARALAAIGGTEFNL